MWNQSRTYMGILLILSLGFLVHAQRPNEDEQRPSLTMQAPVKEQVMSVRLQDQIVDLWAEAPLNSGEASEVIRSLTQSQLSQPNESLDETTIPLILRGSPSAAQFVGKRWIGTWRLTYQGIPLSERSNVTATLLPNGALSIRTRNTPIKIEEALSYLSLKSKPEPKVSAEFAVKLALSELSRVAEQRKSSVNISRLAENIEKRQLQIWVDPESREGHLVWKLEVAAPEGDSQSAQSFEVLVTASNSDNPKLVGVQDQIHQSHNGTVTGPVWVTTPLSPPTDVPLSSVKVVRVTTSSSGNTVQGEQEDAVFTGIDGKFAFPGSGDVQLQAFLKDKHFEIINTIGETQSVTVNSGDQGTVHMSFKNSTEFEVAQVSAFHWAHQVRSFAGEIIGDSQLNGVKVKVNAEGECNAFFNSGTMSLTLYRASAPSSTRKCINRAYLDTIFHEYGHAVDHVCGGIQDGGYSEGFGDSLAILFKEDACYGSNCCGVDTCLRDASEVLTWTDNQNAEVHAKGRVYAGFTWQLLQELKVLTSEAEARTIARDLTLAVCKANPTSIPNAIDLTYEMDDDDGDLTNGTPHAKAITIAAKSRKIPIPEGLSPIH